MHLRKVFQIFYRVTRRGFDYLGKGYKLSWAPRLLGDDALVKQTFRTVIICSRYFNT